MHDTIYSYRFQYPWYNNMIYIYKVFKKKTGEIIWKKKLRSSHILIEVYVHRI